MLLIISCVKVGERTEEMTDTVGRSINNGRVMQSSLGGGMHLLLQIYLVYFLLLISCLYFF